MRKWAAKRQLSWLLALVFILLTPAAGHAAYDFVNNSDFRRGLAEWTVSGNSKDAAIIAGEGEVRFQGLLGTVRHSIEQSLEIDVSQYSSLLLTATVRVDQAQLSGTGLSGNEAPLAVYVIYTDAAGVEHKQLAGPASRFWRGFYYLAPAPPATSVNGQKVAQGVWQDVQIDLMQLEPKPHWVHAIGAEASGWARRSAAIKRLSLIAPEEGTELAVNPNLRQMAAGWRVCVDFTETDYQSEIVPLVQGMQIKSALGNKRAGLMQKIEADVSDFKSLILSAEVKVDRQQLGGTGYNGREAPLALFVTYTDINGVRHDKLPMQPADTANRMFWRGLYILNPQPPAIDTYGVLLPPGEWQTVSFDLMELDPKPRIIHAIGVEGSGRPPRQAAVRLISLKGW